MTNWNKQLSNAFRIFQKRIRMLNEQHRNDEPPTEHKYEYIFFVRDDKKIPTNWACCCKTKGADYNREFLDLPEIFEAMIHECYESSPNKDVMCYKTYLTLFLDKIRKAEINDTNKRNNPEFETVKQRRTDDRI